MKFINGVLDPAFPNPAVRSLGARHKLTRNMHGGVAHSVVSHINETL